MTAGIVLVLIPILAKGPAILYSTAEHVYEDITVDLAPHVLILGTLLILYAFYRMGK